MPFSEANSLDADVDASARWQDEVAQRLTAATPGDYRAMNIEVAYFSRPRYLFKVDCSADMLCSKSHLRRITT